MQAETETQVIERKSLPRTGHTYEFEGSRFQDTEVSFIWVDMPPTIGVRLHEHPYKEIFIIQEGSATFTVGTASMQARAGQVIIVPANTPHKFVNTGDGRLRQVDIHVSPEIITRWLEE